MRCLPALVLGMYILHHGFNKRFPAWLWANRSQDTPVLWIPLKPKGNTKKSSGQCRNKCSRCCSEMLKLLFGRCGTDRRIFCSTFHFVGEPIAPRDCLACVSTSALFDLATLTDRRGLEAGKEGLWDSNRLEWGALWPAWPLVSHAGITFYNCQRLCGSMGIQRRTLTWGSQTILISWKLPTGNKQQAEIHGCARQKISDFSFRTL